MFMDFAKAFDHVDHAIVLKKLAELGVPEFICRWFPSFLSDRQQKVGLTRRSANAKKTARPETQIYGSFCNPRPPHFSSGCGYMVGLGKPKMSTKFEVASLSRCRNIIGNAQNLMSFPSPRQPPHFPLDVIL